ncbi:MAG: preprotein translocase subunit SecY [Phycisphaerales bacterium JB065]
MNCFKIPDLRNKILFTIAMLMVYRIGYWVPVPGVDQTALTELFQQETGEGSAFGRIAQFVSIFSGGTLGQSTIFGMGIMPYISAAIIFQLLGSALPALKKMQEEGPSGRQKIQEWTRYATIGLCIVQAFGWLTFITSQNLVYEAYAHNPMWWAMSISAMTAGTIFLMWLGEQIDKYGIGNGVSLIITAGILAQMPGAFFWLIENSPVGQISFVNWLFGLPQIDPKLSWMKLILLLGAFVGVVAGAVLITVAQRRIPVQQAKHTRGRRVFGGQRSYLPLRVNHGGVMPIIFASSIMIFPSVLFGALAQQTDNSSGWYANLMKFLGDNFIMGQYPYILFYVGMVYFFSYFWTTVQFNPEDMSKQLRDSGSFIPGLRPGPRTAEYLETVMERITYVGAGFLAIIAVIPMVVQTQFEVDFMVASFLGGTGLLIVVSVGLDLIQRVEANLLMRNYAGFLGGNDQGKGPRIRGTRG